MNLKKYIQRFKNARILVIGDVMLDKYVDGIVDRICPEAPVQVLHAKHERCVPGGAANTAFNIAALGGQCFLMGLVGNDTAREKLVIELNKKGINTKGLIEWNNPTIQKIRMTSNGQILMRLDYEEKKKNTKVSEMLEFVSLNKDEIDLIIISDYAKGTVCQELVEGLKKTGIRIIVDPKPATVNWYKNVFLVKPNKKEASQILERALKTDEDVEKAGFELKDKLGCNILITRGSEGMSLFENEHHYIPTQAKEVYDVTGAGDTSLAALGLSIAAGASLKEAVNLANHAAGIAVGKSGTAVVSPNELIGVWDKKETKVKSVSEIKELVLELKKKGKKIVFTNGCFDILHVGHTRLLQKAKSFGDILVLGVNNDASIKRLKDNSRPINNEKDRTEILSALDYVDYIVLFGEDDPLALIKEIIPDIHVKGADYRDKPMIEREFVEESGGRVELVELIEGKSTTGVIERILEKKPPAKNQNDQD